jgi:hypothetical protein
MFIRHALGFLVWLFFSTVVLAGESIPVPIKDKDAFEKQYIECVMSSGLGDCFVSLFSRHYDDSVNNPDDVTNRINSYFLMSLADTPAYQVHIVKKDLIADIFDNRSYIVENEVGGILLVQIGFRKFKGEWYVFDFFVGEDMKALCRRSIMRCL